MLLGKYNAILLNIQINRPRLANACGYKLATNGQNLMKIYLTWMKILQKVSGGTFLTHAVVLCHNVKKHYTHHNH